MDITDNTTEHVFVLVNESGRFVKVTPGARTYAQVNTPLNATRFVTQPAAAKAAARLVAVHIVGAVTVRSPRGYLEAIEVLNWRWDRYGPVTSPTIDVHYRGRPLGEVARWSPGRRGADLNLLRVVHHENAKAVAELAGASA